MKYPLALSDSATNPAVISRLREKPDRSARKPEALPETSRRGPSWKAGLEGLPGKRFRFRRTQHWSKARAEVSGEGDCIHALADALPPAFPKRMTDEMKELHSLTKNKP